MELRGRQHCALEDARALVHAFHKLPIRGRHESRRREVDQEWKKRRLHEWLPVYDKLPLQASRAVTILNGRARRMIGRR